MYKTFKERFVFEEVMRFTSIVLEEVYVTYVDDSGMPHIIDHLETGKHSDNAKEARNLRNEGKIVLPIVGGESLILLAYCSKID